MSNPSKSKGTAAETAVVRWARENGFGHADRQPLRGNRDAGDIALAPGVIVEVKNRRLPTGHPTPVQLTDWMRQTEAERETSRADVGILVVKRAGTTDPGRWFAYVTTGTFAALLGVPDGGTHLPDPDASLCMSLASLLPVLRRAGYGSQLEQEATEVTA